MADVTKQPMALVPVEPTEEMLFDAGSHYAAANGSVLTEPMRASVQAAIAASPNSGQVSRELLQELETAMVICEAEEATEKTYARAALEVLGLSIEGDE